MTRIGTKYISILIVLYAFSLVSRNVRIYSVISLLLIGLVLLLVNMTVKPILTLITLPFTLLTFGLFALIVNTITLSLADALVTGISIDGFWTTLVASTGIFLTQSLLKNVSQ